MVKLHMKQGQPKAPHLVSCDNQALIKTISKTTKYNMIFPNTTMEPEWDCLAQILATIQQLKAITPTMEHVRGHQDEQTLYEELPLLAQLNCNADFFTNSYL